MDRLDFKLNLYYEMYKNKSLQNREEFRKNFTKKHGKFQYLEELIKMIEKYQMKKYGETLARSNLVLLKNREERSKDHKREYYRNKRRLEK